jgi:hypothetical protein
MLPMPEGAFMMDKKEYAAIPLAFIRRYLDANGAEDTASFLQSVRIYPFISDLFGEYLRRGGDLSEASSFLTTVTREVIGDMTLSELCSMMQEPLKILANDEGTVPPSEVATIFRELYLSPLANTIESHSEPLRPEDLERVLSPSTFIEITEPAITTAIIASSESAIDPQSVIPSAPASETVYSDFLSELKDAGVMIPPPAKEPKARPVAKRAAAEVELQASTKASKPKPVAPKSSVSVDSMLSPAAREKIMTKIFRDDKDDFRRSIELIDKAKDWKQASIYLDALFMRRKVDPDSKTATRLTDAVYARFHSVR